MSDFDLMSLIGNDELELDCPNCNAKIPFTLNSANEPIECPKCNSKISLQKSADFDETVEASNDALKEFENTLKNFGN
jgi:DNA-directed RNA polymerase subunit RPC12/RpoP